MKRILAQQPEPLLLIVPLLLLGLDRLFNLGADATNPSESLIQIHNALLFWYLFATVLMALFMHFLLRKSGRWNVNPCRWQVYSTVAITLLFALLFFSQQPAFPASLLESGNPISVRQMLQSGIYGGLLLAGIAIQVLFTGYFLYRIFQRN